VRVLKFKTYEGDDDGVNKISTKLLAEIEGVPTIRSALPIRSAGAV
jgi:hypothetical protein